MAHVNQGIVADDNLPSKYELKSKMEMEHVVDDGQTSDGASSLGSEENEERAGWGSRMEFLLACIGNAVGLGNIWRFPYLAYSSGGGAFLIPYFIMLIVCGIPLLYMEFSMGQFTRQGPIGALQKLSPIFQGAGMATVMLSFLLCTYYNVILTWSLYYMFASFQSVLPWTHCNHTWSSDNCWADYSENATLNRPNNSISASQDFYENRVLQQTDGIDNFGGIRWELLLLLTLSWILVYLALWKGLKITGKVVYFTALFPYVIIIILLIRGVTLEGAWLGIEYFILPEWEQLYDPQVWVNAASQNFNSIGIAFGSMVAFSSYNKRDSNIFRNVLTITILNSFTSILAGFAIFSILGYIALNQGKDVADVATDGPGLIFIVYPEAFSTMPAPQVFSFLFFFMLLCLAIDSQFASVEVCITTLQDHFGPHIKKYLKRRELLVLVVCLTAFMVGLPCIFEGGIYFFKIIDYYSSGISLMVVAFFEAIAVCWFYGALRLAANVTVMTGRRPNIYFIFCWYIMSPCLIAAIMIFNWSGYVPVTYGDYVFPDWALGLGWGMAFLSLVCIPIGAINAMRHTTGDSLYLRFKQATTPQIEDLKSDADEGVQLTKIAITQM